MTREMIFNDASTSVLADSVYEVVPLIVGIAKGIATLVQKNHVSSALRMKRALYEIPCANDGSLLDAIHILRGEDRDAKLFWLRLSQKVPLLTELPAAVIDRFRGCEIEFPNAADGDALVLCVHLDAIAISLPISLSWDLDAIQVRYLELLPEGTLAEATEQIDNLSRAAHADSILERRRSHARESLTPQTFWEARSEVFPRLSFGRDVKEQIARLDPGLFPTVLRRIEDLHASACDWDIAGGPAPPWRSKVTRESEKTRENPRLRATRVFRNAFGRNSFYEWHARYGSSGRIHLLFDSGTRLVEVGYVGEHLPLPH
jgi:hypothetical protein